AEVRQVDIGCFCRAKDGETDVEVRSRAAEQADRGAAAARAARPDAAEPGDHHEGADVGAAVVLVLAVEERLPGRRREAGLCGHAWGEGAGVDGGGLVGVEVRELGRRVDEQGRAGADGERGGGAGRAVAGLERWARASAERGDADPSRARADYAGAGGRGAVDPRRIRVGAGARTLHAVADAARALADAVHAARARARAGRGLVAEHRAHAAPGRGAAAFHPGLQPGGLGGPAEHAEPEARPWSATPPAAVAVAASAGVPALEPVALRAPAALPVFVFVSAKSVPFVEPE